MASVMQSAHQYAITLISRWIVASFQENKTDEVDMENYQLIYET